MRLNFTLHAKEKQIDRGATKLEIIEAITKGSKFRQAGGKIRAQFGLWAVVYRKPLRIKDKYAIITVTYR
ncbi:MAG: hypothetical protein V1911_02920 [Candidatus Micrarchaeota archaeon]